MSNFNIDNSVSSSSSSKNRLVGNAIHDVTFVGAEAVDLKDGEFKVVQIKFENESGEFTDTIFEPKAEDFTRKDNDFEGQNPSGWEEIQAKVRHLIKAVNPELDKKIEDGTKPLAAKTWDDFRKIVVAAVAKHTGKATQIKLINNGKGEPRFPSYVLGISKAGNLYMKTNFIGENLQFTPKETERMAKAATAKPTNMATQGSSKPADSGAADDLDFDIEDL